MFGAQSAQGHSRTKQLLWWNDACYHAFVARNGSWSDFRALAHIRIRQHSLFLQDPLLERVAWFCDVPLPPCSQACVLSHPPHFPVATPDLCHVKWHGASRSALPPDEARSQWRHFSSPTGDVLFSDDFFPSFSLCFGVSHVF